MTRTGNKMKYKAVIFDMDGVLIIPKEVEKECKE